MYRRLSKIRAVAVFTGLSLMLGVGSASAAVTVDGCLRTIAKEAQGFAKKKATALRKCQDGVLKGKVTGPCPDSKNAQKIADAQAKAEAKIIKKCTGGFTSSGVHNSDCSSAGVPDACCSGQFAGTCFPSNLGFTSLCPRPECATNIDTEADLAACVTCNVESLVDDLEAGAYGSLTAPSGDKATLNCQRTFGKEIMGAFAKIGKAKQKCEDGKLKGKIGSCPDAKTNDKIGKALSKILDKIDKKCTGVIGDAVQPASLVGNFGSQANVGPTVESIAEAQVQSSLGAAVCGDAIRQSSESCDDGNNFEDDGTGALDTCPASCNIGPCTAPFGSQTATVSFDQGSAAVGLTSLTVVVRYNDLKVAIPGSGGDANVNASVTPAGTFSITPGDTDYSLRGVLLDGSFAGAPSGTAFTIDFDTCNGAPAPTAGDFTCVVAAASDENLAAVTDATCSVSVP